MSGAKGSKFDSGAAKRKRKKAEDLLVELQKGALLKHFKPILPAAATADEAGTSLSPEESSQSSSEAEHSNVSTEDQVAIEQHASASSIEPGNSIEGERMDIIESDKTVDLTDISMWPEFLNDNQRMFVVENGVKQVTEIVFPSNDSGRHFSQSLYKRKLPNGEVINRAWLIYSIKKDCVFCCCCKVFANSKSKLAKDGYNNWKHISNVIHEHESSTTHTDAQYHWIKLENRLAKLQTIDKKFQQMISAEKMHWQNVLKRLIAVVQFLSQRNMAF